MAHERIIEGTWRCTSCGTEKILARHARCPTCNNPREQADADPSLTSVREPPQAGSLAHP